MRNPEDLRAIYEATRRGNYPLLRCYSGTRDLLKWAEMLVETINNAWCAVPLTWYSCWTAAASGRCADTIAEDRRSDEVAR